MNTAVLKQELATDPVNLGYAGKTSQQKADLINVVNRPVDKSVMNGAEIWGCVDGAEYAALPAIQREALNPLFSAASIDLKNVGIKTKLNAIFGAGPSKTALQAAMKTMISRATELGLGFVTAQDVIDAEA